MAVDEQAGDNLPPEPGQGPDAPRARKPNRWIVEVLVVVVIAIVIAFLLRTYVVATYSIPSGSMEPTLQVGDRIVVDKLSYDLHGVDRGNIIVFSTPPKEDCAGPPVSDLVKRVIGLPGETISLSAGRVYINGHVLHEPWLPAAVRTETYPGPSQEPYALHNPYRVAIERVAQPVAKLDHQSKFLGQRHRRASADDFLQALALHQLHGDVRQAI